MSRISPPAELADRLAAFAAALRRSGAIGTDPVQAAFATVPRHRFLPSFYYRGQFNQIVDGQAPGEVLDLVYANNALLTHSGQDGDPPSSSSAPSLMAKMLDALQLRSGMRVLEIGAGTGYNAALIHTITGAEVVTVEAGTLAADRAAASIDALGLAPGVHVIHGDGYDGDPEHRVFDRIIVTCGIAGIPQGWLDQLAPDGMILAPIAHAGVHPIMSAHRAPSTGTLTARIALWGDFMSAAGRLRPGELFGHDPADEVPADRVRPAAGTGVVLDPVRYNDLWMYLGTQDTRTTRAYLASDTLDPGRGACALVDPVQGTVWVHQDGGITLAGTDDLRDDAVMLVGRWQELDRPAATEWITRLGPADTGGLLLPYRWHRSARRRWPETGNPFV